MFPFLLLLLSASVSAGPNPLYARVDGLIGRYYLHPEEIDVARALELAAEAAEDAVPWLMVERVGDTLRFIHGEAGPFGVLELPGLPLVAGLAQIEGIISQGPGALPEDIELPVELLRGATRALDPHTTLLYEGRLKRFDERVQGTFAGVGARIGQDEGALIVREVFLDSPAARGGLAEGDRILEIDGFSTVGLTTDQSVRRIRGPEGSEVALTVERVGAGGVPQQVELRITRGIIRIPNVSWALLDSGVLHIEIENFSKQTVSYLEEALAELDGVKGVVLDLRGNTGGSLQQACGAADLFLGEQTIVRTVGRDGAPVRGLMESCESGADHLAGDLPVAVLVDGDSASASEIVAGALQYFGRGLLVGQRTFGKGTVQKAYAVRGGSDEDKVQLKITEAEYLVGGERRIEYHQGLDPDVEVGAVYFNAGGAWLAYAEAADFVLVDERPGWREKTPDFELHDVTLELAERALLAAEGPDAAALTAAFQRAHDAVMQEQDALLVETFAVHGLDWSPAPEAGPAPQVSLRWLSPETFTAGGEVELELEVTNTGPSDLHRVYVQVDADDSNAPWGGRTFAVGRVPAGESRVGKVRVTLSPRTRARMDRLDLTLHADQRPAVELASRSLRIEPVEPAPIAVSASVRPHSDAHALALDLENLGEEPLGELRAWVALSEDAVVSLLARETVLDGLGPKEQARTLIPIQVPPGLSLVEGLELRVEVEGRGEALRVPLSLAPGAPALRLEAPRVDIDMPLTAEVGPATARVRATDDSGIVEITAWWDGEQVAWRSGGSRDMQLELPLVVEPGQHAFWVEVVDDQGIKVMDGHKLQGPRPQDDGRAER